MQPAALKRRLASCHVVGPSGLFALLALSAGGGSLLLGGGVAATALHDSVGLAASAAIFLGVLLHRPKPAVPWALVGLSIFFFGTGDVVYAIDPAGGISFVFSIGGWLYIGGGLSLVTALAGFGDRRVRTSRVSRLLFVDSAALFLGAFLLIWFLVFDGQLDVSAPQATPARMLIVVFPMLDVLMLALAGRLLLTGAARLPAFGLLVGGIVFGLLGDLIWRGFLTDSSYGTLWVSGSFYVCYAFLGAAGLHPSMRELTAVDGPADTVMPIRRLPLVGASLTTVPLVVLLRHSQINDPFGLTFFGIAATLIPALVVYRLIDLVAVGRRLAAQAESSAGRLSALLGASPLPVAVLNADGKIGLWNEAAELVSGWPAEVVLGTEWPSQESADDRRLLNVRDRALAGERFDRVELNLRRRDGELRRLEVSTAPVMSAEKLEAVVAVFADVTDERARQDEVRYLAEHDSLTGLLNRRSFQERLRAKAAQTRVEPLVLAVVDIDNFKLVNDSAGHLVGDQMLCAIAQMITSELRADDLCARLSGDEFAVLISGTSLGQAMQIAERLVQVVRAYRLPTDSGSVDVTISIGLAVLPPAEDSVRSGEEALVLADTALYEAKKQGRNRAVAWNPSLARNEQITSARDWSTRIKEALDEGRVIIHTQPIVDLQDGSIVYYEALSRMLDDQGTLIPPAAFLPHAHRLGLTEQVDANTIDLALELLEDDPELRLFVNLDPESFDSDRTLDWLEQVLRDRPELAGRFGIEITERAPVRDYARAKERLNALSALGCLIAIDDFGSDFSSFEHLRALPADIVKIGDNFIAKLGTDPVTDALLDAVVSAAHALSKRVIAEGVETEEIASLLRDRGVEYAQGYLYGRPQPTNVHQRVALVA